MEEERSRVRLLPANLGAKPLNKDRSLGIPEEHIILNVSDGVELEVVTEAAPDIFVGVAAEEMKRGQMVAYDGEGKIIPVACKD